ncbi:MAG: Uma2 family endonuclease [Cyanobacteria bacterium P01_F01_bin.150]
MNIALSPQTVPIPWSDYLAGNYDRSLIPWARYRYSGTGVVEVSGEAVRNVEIADELRFRLRSELRRLGHHWKCYTDSISLEVELSDKEERIPDLMVITADTRQMMPDESRIVTLDMPAPILVVEVVSPSSVKDDLEIKPFEYMGRGVGEYVSIDWRKEIVQVWSCTEDGKNYNFSEYRSGEQVILKSFPTLVITVAEMILKP